MRNLTVNSTCPLKDNSSCSGLILPLIPRTEKQWPVGLAATLYCLALIYSFLAVSAIADIFMCAIEFITSRTKSIKVTKQGHVQEVQVKVWNPTIANLSLMALGSSAPEILLSVIEIVGNDFEAGDLGPSTIVGSAAFNLLIITAVCMVSVPSGEVRRIKEIKVFVVTALFSVFAYVWLYITLKVSSPDEVELWEAFITLFLFVVLLVTAYAADKHFWMKKVAPESFANNGIGNSTHLNPVEIDRLLDGRSQDELTPEEASTLALRQIASHKEKSHLWYRVNSIRYMVGGRRLIPELPITSIEEDTKENVSRRRSLELNHLVTSDKAVVQFSAFTYSVYEKEKKVVIGLVRQGRMDVTATVRFHTTDGTALAGQDYCASRGQVVFLPNQTHQTIEIPIIDDEIPESDEVFFIKLCEPDHMTAIGSIYVAEVTILDDDSPGTLQFSQASYSFVESAGHAQLTVSRIQGTDGEVFVDWSTRDGSAVAGKDYVTSNGTLNFKHGESMKSISIGLIDDKTFEKDEVFYVDLSKATGGAKLGRTKTCLVTIVDDDEYKTWADAVVRLTGLNMHLVEMGASTWGQQFHEAMTVNGGDVESATFMDYVMHFLTFAFKVLFAFVPPVSFGFGWPAFIVSLCFIGILTAIIGDLANIFGCFVGIEPSVTAITFVAIGTSLPDLFASRTAALSAPYADAAIGNVTGSNSVNVFLGLGVSWLLAASYWLAKDEPFVVPSGTLAFSVISYIVVAVVCIGMLFARRYIAFLGMAELGGPQKVKYISAAILVVLWILYVTLASLKAYCVI